MDPCLWRVLAWWSTLVVATSSPLLVATSTKGTRPAHSSPTSVCSTGTVCAAKFSGNDQGCCPYADAVCCENAMTCCPSGSTCNVSGWQSTCIGAPANQRVGQPVCKFGAPLPFSKTLPNVLIIGDSVSIGYTPKVAAHMSSVALVQHSPWDVRDGGAEETAYGVTCLPTLLRSPTGQFLEPDVLMFNWGLHDGPLKNVVSTNAHAHTYTERRARAHTQRERDRQTDRQTDRQIDR